MAIVVIPDALQVVVSGQNLGTSWVNVWGVKNEGTFIMAQSVADEIGAAFVSGYGTLATGFNIGYSLDSVVVRDLRSSTSPAYDALITGFSGTNASHALAPQTAAVISHSTGLRGGSYRGRTYVSGLTEDSNEGDGSIATAARAGLLTMVAEIEDNLSTVTGGPFLLAVLSRKLLEANEITSSTVNPEWDHQDRRKRG